MGNSSSHIKLIAAVVIGLVVLTAFGVPVWANIPLLAILLVCPLILFFMMRGMGGMDHGKTDDTTTDSDSTGTAHKH